MATKRPASFLDGSKPRPKRQAAPKTAARRRQPVAQPHLCANLERYRAMIGIPHRYWNRDMSRQVQWTLYIIDALPPAHEGQLRIRLVVEARQTNHDGTGTGEIIGPSIRMTPLLIELEKRTKAASPPDYYGRREETTRKACDQLTVNGERCTWLLKEYLQGQTLLTDAMVPPQALRDPDFVPSFDRECIERELTQTRSRGRRKVAPRGGHAGHNAHNAGETRAVGATAAGFPRAGTDGATATATAALAPARATSRVARTCRGCGSGSFVSFCDGAGMNDTRSGLGIATGASCSRCALALCGTCVFRQLVRYCETPLARMGIRHPFTCTNGGSTHGSVGGGVAFRCGAQCEAQQDKLREIAWFADPDKLLREEATAAFVVRDPEGNAVADVGRLEERLDRAEEHREIWSLWAQCPTSCVVHACASCGVLSLVSVLAARATGSVACLCCTSSVCARCGEPGCDRSRCQERLARLALLDDERRPWGAAHRVENAVYAALRCYDRSTGSMSSDRLARMLRVGAMTDAESRAFQALVRIIPGLRGDRADAIDAAVASASGDGGAL